MSNYTDPTAAPNKVREVSLSAVRTALSHGVKQGNANWNTSVGALKQSVGETVGISSLASSGREQKAAGDAEHAAAEAQEMAESAGEAIKGKANQVFGALTGDNELEAAGRAQHEKGVAGISSDKK